MASPHPGPLHSHATNNNRSRLASQRRFRRSRKRVLMLLPLLVCCPDISRSRTQIPNSSRTGSTRSTAMDRENPVPKTSERVFWREDNSFGVLPPTNLSFSASGQRSKMLSLRGRVESVEIKEVDWASALIDIKVKMELVNTGVKPIIFLKREPLFPGGALAKKPDDFEIGTVLVADAGWPSNDISPEWATLRANLDKPSPPTDETRFLMPGESWPLETSVRLVVPTDSSKYTSSRNKESLAVIQQLPRVWLRVVCEVWPTNVEPLTTDRSDLEFGHKLRQRWKETGLLWLDEIYSEPIAMDVKTASYKPRTR